MFSSPRIMPKKKKYGSQFDIKDYKLWAVSFFLSPQICPHIQVTSENAPEAPVIKETWSVAIIKPKW